MTDVLLKRAEVARQLGISEDTIKRMETRGQLPRVILSPRIVRYRQSDIDAIISSGGHADLSRHEMASNDRVQSFSRHLVSAERPDLPRSAPIGKNFHK